MSAAFINEDFVPINPPLHGVAAAAAKRQAAIQAETQRMFAAQDERLARRAALAEAKADLMAALA